MERQRSKRERGNVNAVQLAVCAPSAALVNTPGCAEHLLSYISLLLLLLKKKKVIEKKEFCVYVFVCVYVNARLQALCRDANNKLSCWLLICMDKRSHNEPHYAIYLVHHLKEAAVSVTHKNLQVSP